MFFFKFRMAGKKFWADIRLSSIIAISKKYG